MSASATQGGHNKFVLFTDIIESHYASKYIRIVVQTEVYKC